MTLLTRIATLLKETISITEHIDREKAELQIRSNLYFRGPNAWILAFSVIIASVGLNVNSIPVIIGAMLISPLMGPIYGVGFAIGLNDMDLLTKSIKNLLIMMGIALFASVLYFLITPLTLTNPTELLARTNPTIYDVLIALFGGAAGMFEQCRKEKGTVFSGVAIATALMPPLCTAGFGLAVGNLHYFLGALYLFMINCVFIALATYAMTKMFNFRHIAFTTEKAQKKSKWIMATILIAFIVPSILSAIVLVRNNDFDGRAAAFVRANRAMGNTIIYDYNISHEKGNKLEILLSGSALEEDQKVAILQSAADYGISEKQLEIKENATSKSLVSSEIFKDIYINSERQLARKDEEIEALKNELSKLRDETIPYAQITKEAISFYPSLASLGISEGSNVTADSLKVTKTMFINAKTTETMKDAEKAKLLEWLKIRLGSQNVELDVTTVK
jgi:Predicted membrane protein